MDVAACLPVEVTLFVLLRYEAEGLAQMQQVIG